MSRGTVLLRRSALGDVVLMGAVTGQVQAPVTVVTAPAWVDVARQMRGVKHVIAWPREMPPHRMAAQLPPGELVDLQGTWRSAQVCLATRRRWRRVRKRSLSRRLRLWWGVGPRRPPVPTIYGEACGVTPSEAPWIDLPRQERDTLVLVPGAAWPVKQWREAGFVQLGRAWDGPIVVLGGPGEEELCQRVGGLIPQSLVVAERGFSRTLEILARAVVTVAGDTGLAHLAGACGSAVIAVFGPTSPDDGFFVYPGEVVQRDLSCRPCTLHRQPRCPKGHHGCMELPADQVLRAVRRVWEVRCTPGS